MSSKPLIITYPEVSPGFRLSGIEVKEFKEGDDITPFIISLLEKGEYGLLAVEEGLLSRVPDGVMKRIRRAGIPVIVPINTPRAWRGGEEVESYIIRLIRRAIGYQVRIKR
ncbi:MAG: ATPase [Deltaproteobacteria bacterium]|nr:ATPase [Deltaproteobacteria bacterium]